MGENIMEILHVEDNQGDVFLTQKAFDSMDVKCDFRVAPDGEVALKMLRKEGKFSDQQAPDLILLDINLPKLNGKDVLKIIKEDEHLRLIPVVVLSSSPSTHDIWDMYNMQANSYLLKPSNFAEYKDVAVAIENFWFETVLYPHHDVRPD